MDAREFMDGFCMINFIGVGANNFLRGSESEFCQIITIAKPCRQWYDLVGGIIAY